MGVDGNQKTMPPTGPAPADRLPGDLEEERERTGDPWKMKS